MRPQATLVAESLGEDFGFPSPVVEGGGTGAGLERFCEGVGEDQIDGDHNEALARLDANPDAVGEFGRASNENNTDKRQVATVGGIAPSTETIAPGGYPVSRPLFM